MVITREQKKKRIEGKRNGLSYVSLTFLLFFFTLSILHSFFFLKLYRAYIRRQALDDPLGHDK